MLKVVVLEVLLRKGMVLGVVEEEVFLDWGKVGLL